MWELFLVVKKKNCGKYNEEEFSNRTYTSQK